MSDGALPPTLLRELTAQLAPAHRRFAARFPGTPEARQPLHTVYGGAHIFRPDTAAKLGALALRSLETYAPDAGTFARAAGIGGDDALAVRVHERMLEKLRREPVEDFRIDFEDGYGNRGDAEEDACAARAAEAVARGLDAGSLPPFLGIRIKPFTAELAGRGLRTLDLFLTHLARETDGRWPDPFVVTLPKIVNADQARVLDRALTAIEEAAGLAPRTVRVELMVETTQAIIGPDGRCPLADMVAAANGRCVAAHFGVYDYTAGCSIIAEHQHMSHPCCDFARHVMQVSLEGTGVWLSDGTTNIMPVGPHAPSGDTPLSPTQREANRAAVHRAWRLHADDVRRSLRHGFYQGWDLHPAQLPTRYAAAYEFFLRGLDTAADRLRNFVDRAAQATLAGDVFDDAATGQGLLNFFLRGLGCGAITTEEAAASGLTREEMNMRSFAKIIAARASRS